MLQLFGHPFSSYTWKALIPLYAYAVPFEFQMLDREHPGNQAVVQTRTPAGKFPLLLDGDETVFEATAIIEHLAATLPACRTLLPSDPRAAARMRMLDRVFDNYVMTNVNRVVHAHIASPAAPDAAEITAAGELLARAYRWLENWLEAEVSIAACFCLVTSGVKLWIRLVNKLLNSLAASLKSNWSKALTSCKLPSFN